MERKWTLRLVTALIWTAAGVSILYWGWWFSEQGAARNTPPPAVITPAPAPDKAAVQADIARLLGAPTASNSAANLIANRFSLIGVVTSGNGGAALITVDGKPAKPYPVGGRIDENTVLQSVGPRHAVLAASIDGPPLQRLELQASNATSQTAAAPLPPPNQAPAGLPPEAAPNYRPMRQPEPSAPPPSR